MLCPQVRPRMTHTLTRKGMSKSEDRSTPESLCYLRIVILVPRSATFSTCTKTDSDMMFWAIQNPSINIAEVIIERMKFAHAQVWDKKSKLNVSLPYTHLLTKISQHCGINLSGAVSEKMGQVIHCRNLKKSGFSLVGGVWTKTSVDESEAIIGEAKEVLEGVAEVAVAADVPVEQEDQQPATTPVVQEQQQEVVSLEIAMYQVAAAAELRAEESVVTRSQIEDIPQDNIEPVMRVLEAIIPTTVVASILRDVLESIPSPQGQPERSSESVADVVASGHTDDVVMEDAPIEGEQSFEKEATLLGERTTSTPVDDQVREDIVESASGEEDNDDNVEPVARASNKGKEVAQDIPLLTRKPRHKELKINMKPVVERLDEQGSILCSVRSDIASIFISQSQSATSVGALTSVLQHLKSELVRLKQTVIDLLVFVREHLPIHAPPASSSGPSGPSVDDEV
ncbi:hypothetical protein Taro_000788 [Colocasia esculenta]|uniref:Uncharacterized protein n=1 Tax=Colocasia esculenta TaxID=4460 RepID=A0A843T862_COLES|nr:hypothetical protein [Colocasia esculenta]